jgi:uncharacterized metal-binding protein YceD (DUF177 family)
MKKKNQRLIIPFSGLKLGVHNFSFQVDKAFFEQYEFSIIQNTEVEIEVEFNKKSTLFELQFDFKGKWYSQCDRCNDPLTVDIEGQEELIVKFGNEVYQETDEIKIIPADAYELDISDEVYEFIHLQLPSKVAHKKTDNCNQDVIRKLEEINQKEDQKDSKEIDPRWAKLEQLKQANKID